ncbi:hypothetical protein Nepgr_021549 [Nepenthes gracilis]|uniref:AT-hook motif nuclear-localized protein n=1 Tax=Nepenthes gracilis TaxID=150966 RepID=A0AAD3XW61_NEPGR|nr:hypothetical protein Nepgr_021549 [Nepenthes gracilis]
MEGREEINFGVTVKGDEAAENFRVSSRAENQDQQLSGHAMAITLPISMPAAAMDVKKKRGRPRKYGPDGSLTTALSPMPISASIPLTGDFSAWKHARVKPFQAIKKARRLEYDSLGDQLAYLVGSNFTPHVITVNAGEDVAMKVLSFSHQESRAICVLSASGSISNVTLRQPNSSGGTMTYEGRFEILSLTGSFMPTDNGIMKSRSGGLSVSLAGPDGRVFGGALAGLLVAASPVQVVLGSFLPGHQEQKPKKNKVDVASPTPLPISGEVVAGDGYIGNKDPKSAADFTSRPQFHHHNSNPGSLNPEPEKSSSSPEGDSNDDGPSNCEISG